MLVSMAQTGQSGLTAAELATLMSDLAHLPDNRALALLRKLAADVERWGIPRRPKHSHLLIRGLCAVGRVGEAYSLADSMGKAIRIEDWRVILGAAAGVDSSVATLAFDRLRPSGLGTDDFALLVRDLRSRRLSNEDANAILQQVLADIETSGVTIGKPLQVELVHLYTSLGEYQQAREIVEQWDSTQVERDPRVWNAHVDYLVATRPDAAIVRSVLRRCMAADLVPPYQGLQYLVRIAIKDKIEHAPDLRWMDISKIVQSVQTEFRVGSVSAVWADALRFIISENVSFELVLDVYDEARSLGVHTDARLAQALIKPMCDRPTPMLSQALDVYADFISRPIVKEVYRDRSRIQAIYAHLLRACRGDTDPAIPLRLLRDMRTNDVQLPTSVLRDLIVALIASSSSHHDAFNYYAHFHATSSSTLDADAYSRILTAFINLSTPSSPHASPKYYLEIHRDMQAAGYTASAHAITSLLASYSRRAAITRKTSSDPIFHRTKIDGLHRAIDDVYAQVKLGSIQADIPLLNALMNAYSRVGAYTSAFQVWDMLVERRTREDPAEVPRLYGPSVSIIIDACGRTDQYSRGKRIMGWTKRHGIMSQRILEGWIECLCRLRQFDEAADLVCVQMKKLTDDEVRQAVVILLKFSWTDKRAYEEVQELVKGARPGLWDEVKGIVETKSTRNGDVEDDLD